MDKAINIIEFPSNLRLKKTNYANEPGVKFLPDWLNQWGFHQKICPINVFRVNPPEYSMELDKASGVRNADKIVEYAKKQCELLKNEFNDNSFQIILGGDCSILIGNCLALKSLGEFGLFFIDGHTDYIWPELSLSGGAAGMDLAIVTGNGNDKLTDIDKLQPYIREENVYCVGNRYFDELYLKPIINSEIHYFDLNKLREVGIEIVVNDFLAMVENKKLNGFFIHLDVDVLNDDIMPAVDSREKGGLSYPEITEILKLLFKSRKAFGIEITILDPDLDPNGIYTKPFVETITNIIL